MPTSDDDENNVKTKGRKKWMGNRKPNITHSSLSVGAEADVEAASSSADRHSVDSDSDEEIPESAGEGPLKQPGKSDAAEISIAVLE